MVVNLDFSEGVTPALRAMRVVADPTRLRLLALVRKDELSVQELQQVTRMGQSRISTHLGLLQDAGLVRCRRDGKRSLYRCPEEMDAGVRTVSQIALEGVAGMPWHAADQVNLKRILGLRRDQARLFFNQVAGRFDRSYGPGRSWQAFGQMLLRMLPPLVVADLGSGEGLVSELLALRCRKVIAVDNSEKIVAFGAAKARRNGVKNLEFRLGDLQDPPIETASVDAVILSQALHHAPEPARALRGAHRILRPGGQLLILDLGEHGFAQARELYGDHWLGFPASDLQRWLEEAGFKQVEVTVVAREEEPPHFETVLATGVR